MEKIVIKEGYAIKNIKTGVINDFGSIFTLTPEDYKELRVIEIDDDKYYVDDNLNADDKLVDVIR